MANLAIGVPCFTSAQPSASNSSTPRLALARLDSELVDLAKEGDGDAFAELVERHNRFCMAKAYLRNHANAEEEVQTSWLQVWRHLGTFRSEGLFRAWLSRIVTNQCLMRLRDARLAPQTSIDEVYESQGRFRLELVDQSALPEIAVGNEQASRVLKKEIRGIPPLLREVLVMRDVRHKEMPAVAALLGITISAAKSRLMRGRAELRRRLLKHLGANGPGAMLQQGTRQRAIYVRAS